MPLQVSLGVLAAAAKVISGVLPAFFAGTIFGFNYILLPPILKHSEEHVLARQWLQAYQFGARYVRPLVQTTVATSAFLLYSAATTSSSGKNETEHWAIAGYSAALLSLPALMAYTLGVMEPGINGALKAKVKMLEGEKVQLIKDRVPVGEERDTATPASRERAESESLRRLVMEWKRSNDWRMGIALVGAVASVWTSVTCSSAVGRD